MKTKKWISEFRENIGKKMLKFNFQKFLSDKQISVEELSKICGYTLVGTISMLERGTIKPNTLLKIKKVYSKLDKYL